MSSGFLSGLLDEEGGGGNGGAQEAQEEEGTTNEAVQTSESGVGVSRIQKENPEAVEGDQGGGGVAGGSLGDRGPSSCVWGFVCRRRRARAFSSSVEGPA